MSGSNDCGRSVSCGTESSIAGGGNEPVPVWGSIPDGRRFIEEVHRRGAPDLRPWVTRVVLPRTARMSAREEQFRGRALFAIVLGDTCRFKCWSIYARDTAGKMEYKTVISIEGMPEEAWEWQAVNMLIAALDGELIEILPATDRWVLPVTAWLRDPSAVPKLLTLTLHLPAMSPADPGCDGDMETPPPPCSPKEKRTRDYTLILHVKEVINHGEVFEEDMDPMYYPGEDLSRRHTFKT
ncbi:unnamed protein product [Alopecurus aequalis]